MSESAEPEDHEVPPPEVDVLPIGVRLAALLLALRAIVGLLVGGWLATHGDVDRTFVFASVIDGLLAVGLFIGYAQAVAIALARALIGGIVGVALAVGGGMPIAGVIDALAMLAVMLMLFGVASPTRAKLGLAVGVAAELGLVLLLTTDLGALLRGSADELRSRHLPYHLTLPPTGWIEASENERALEMPDTDAWATRPDVGAEVFVIAELGVDPSLTSLGTLEHEAVESLDVGPVVVVDREDLPRGRLVHAIARVDGTGDVDVLFGVFLVPGVAYRVVAVIDSPSFPTHERELRDIVRSFDPGR